MDRFGRYVNKTVPLKFKGQELSFDLSHALFSSFDIDQGSRLLLKAVAQRVAPDDVSSILDIGSGVGVLGVACARAYPGAALTLRDRDALACAFSERNARRNRVAAAVVERALFLEGLEDKRFDLVLCNVPAKAGPPVLDRFLRDLPLVLSERGWGAIVVVDTIAEDARVSLLAGGAALAHEEHRPGHLALIFRRGEADNRRGEADNRGATRDRTPAFSEAFWAAALRREETVRTARGAYALSAYWSLPEFDTPSFDTSLMMELADSAMAGLHVRRVALINPGVGRLACRLATSARSAVFDLSGRDVLALAAARRNLAGLTGRGTDEGIEIPFSWDLPSASYDLLAERPDIVPRLDLGPAAWEEAARVLKRGGSYLVAMPSTAMDRFERQRPKSFSRIAERKRKGVACAAWRLEG